MEHQSAASVLGAMIAPTSLVSGVGFPYRRMCELVVSWVALAVALDLDIDAPSS